MGYNSWQQLQDIFLVAGGYNNSNVCVFLEVSSYKLLDYSSFADYNRVLVFFLVNERIRLPEYIEVKEMACGYLKAVLKK